jgi:hypothetical protein
MENVRHSPVGANGHPPENMRGCHDPAGVFAVERRETRIDVLLTERSLEFDRGNRARALTVSEFIRAVVVRSDVRGNPDEARLAIAAPAKTGPACQPVEAGIDPLYLFVCGHSWGRYSNTSAGWELVRCLRSPGQGAQIAAALLAQVENKPGGIPVPAINVCAINHPGKPSPRGAAGLPPVVKRWL